MATLVGIFATGFFSGRGELRLLAGDDHHGRPVLAGRRDQALVGGPHGGFRPAPGMFDRLGLVGAEFAGIWAPKPGGIDPATGLFELAKVLRALHQGRAVEHLEGDRAGRVVDPHALDPAGPSDVGDSDGGRRRFDSACFARVGDQRPRKGETAHLDRLVARRKGHLGFTPVEEQGPAHQRGDRHGRLRGALGSGVIGRRAEFRATRLGLDDGACRARLHGARQHELGGGRQGRATEQCHHQRRLKRHRDRCHGNGTGKRPARVAAPPRHREHVRSPNGRFGPETRPGPSTSGRDDRCLPAFTRDRLAPPSGDTRTMSKVDWIAAALSGGL